VAQLRLLRRRETYLFEDVVHPERAQITLQLPPLGFQHVTSGTQAVAHVSIILNQIALWVESATEWDIFDLRNVAKSILQNELAIVGYLKGYAYDVEIRRVLNRARNIDYVFGIDIPCIAKRNEEIKLAEEVEKIRAKTLGDAGIYFRRCFADLIAAMKTPDDTGFYCYRAIEALRQYCIVRYKLDPEKTSDQWSKVRVVSGCDEQTLRDIKAAADPVRHGAIVGITSSDRETLFTKTWDVVDGFLKNA
jgi:hypothetical protein